MNKKTKKVTVAGVSVLVSTGLILGSVEYASHTFRENNRMAIAAESVAHTEEEKEEKTEGKEKGEKSAVSKTETVYINAKADGSIDSVTVSEWLQASGYTGNIADVSELTDIKNVKGDEEFTQSGNEVNWNLAGEDIYYQGKTDKELPVEVKITYKLDGQELTPEEIAGKSGKLEMKFTYINRETTTAQIDGKEEEIHVPFLMVTGMFLPTDKFSNITIDNGKIVSEGNNQIVVGIGMPGLSKSLDMDEEVAEKIPGSFTITADVENFSMGNTLTYATSSLLGDLEFDDIQDTDELTDSIDELIDASAKLVSGSKDLKEGIEKLADKYEEFDDGITELTDGIHTLAEGGDTLSKGAGTYIDGVETLGNGVTAYVKGTKELTGGVKAYVKGNKTLAKGIQDLDSAVSDFPTQYETFSAGLTTYTAGVKKLTDTQNMSTLTDGAKKIDSGVAGINEGAAKLSAGVDTLNTGLTTLEESYAYNQQMIDTLKESIETAKTAKTAAENAVAAYTGAGDTVNAAIYQTQATMLSGQIQSLNELVAQLETLTTKQKSGVKDLKNATSGESDLKKGIESIVSVTSEQGTLKKGTASLSAGVSTMAAGAKTLYDSTETLTEANGKISKGISSVAEAASKLSAGADELTANNKSLKQGAAKLEKSGLKLKSGAKKLLANNASLKGGIKELLGGINKLEKGGNRIKTASGKLADGIDELFDGSVKLADGMKEFDKEGISEIDDLFNEELVTLKERFEALSDAADEYKSFAGISSDMEGSVKFIYETEEIAVEEE